MQQSAGHPEAMAFPIAEGFRRIGIKPTKGFELIKLGTIETFTIGRHRYITLAEIQKFIADRIAEAKAELPEQRAGKVKKAVSGAARARAVLELIRKLNHPAHAAARAALEGAFPQHAGDLEALAQAALDHPIAEEVLGGPAGVRAA